MSHFDDRSIELLVKLGEIHTASRVLSAIAAGTFMPGGPLTDKNIETLKKSLENRGAMIAHELRDMCFEEESWDDQGTR